jgi:peptidylprolyl isomerase
MNNYTLWAIVATVLVVLGLGVFITQTKPVTINTIATSTINMTDLFSSSTPSVPDNQSQTMLAGAQTNSQPVVTMTTSVGVIKLELFADKTPNTVANFLKLAQAGFYDGTLFHRVIPNFMVQGGDPLTKAEPKNWGIHGTGGPGYKFADEIGPTNSNAIGTISMANAGPNTNGSQFFINVADNSFLNPKHTVFGKVVAGMDVVNKIIAVKTNENDHPLEDVKIEKIEIK